MEKDNNPFDVVKITVGDVARAVGDIAMGLLRHLPEAGYHSSRTIQEESAIRTQQMFEFPDYEE